jgi:hypothetical protein
MRFLFASLLALLPGALSFGDVPSPSLPSVCDQLAQGIDAEIIRLFTTSTMVYMGMADDGSLGDNEDFQITAYTSQPYLGGAVPDADAFYSLDPHTKALLGSFAFGIDQADWGVKGNVMYHTCATLTPSLCPVDIIDVEAITDAHDMRQIMGSFIASMMYVPTNVWPVDNYDFDNGVWSSDTWEAASEAEQDGAVRAFSRYNAVNAAMLDRMDGDQTTVDSAFGITPESPAGDFRARMTVFSSSPPTIVENFPVPTNVFDVSALSEGIYLVEGDDDARVDWGTFYSYSDADKLAFTKKASKAYAIIGASQEGNPKGAAAYCSCDGGSKLDHSIPATGCCLQAGRVPDISGDPALSQDLTGWGCNFEE